MAKRSTRGRSNGPSGLVVWTLWLIVIGLLALIARYAFIAAQPDRGCYTLLSHDPACGVTKDYSKSDRAKLNQLVDEALPAKR